MRKLKYSELSHLSGLKQIRNYFLSLVSAGVRVIWAQSDNFLLLNSPLGKYILASLIITISTSQSC